MTPTDRKKALGERAGRYEKRGDEYWEIVTPDEIIRERRKRFWKEAGKNALVALVASLTTVLILLLRG